MRTYLLFALTLVLLSVSSNQNVHAKYRMKTDKRQDMLQTQGEIYDAVEAEKVSSVRILLSRGVDVNFKYRDSETLLMRAAEKGDTSIAGLLINHGAKTDCVAFFRFTALDFAVLSNHLAMVKFLLKNGASLNSVNHSAPPLVVAADIDHVTIMRMLLKAGAHVNAPDAEGNTALMNAVRRDDPIAVKLLLDSKADKYLKDRHGESALSIARQMKSQQVRSLLGELSNHLWKQVTRSVTRRKEVR